MRNLATQRPISFIGAVTRAGIVWSFTVCFIYGPTGCSLGAAMLLLLAGFPAVVFAGGLWLITARPRRCRRCIMPAEQLCARLTGALGGAMVPVLALLGLPAAQNAGAAAIRLVLGTTALLTPVWMWIGSGAGTLLLENTGARTSQSVPAYREPSPSGEFVHTLA